ncbi:MAG: sigma-70 family RNA polymerase sigma factor [bacterium]|nr:sigma-70 family RNA polymerase sigma factor [bacterium]
MRPSDEKLLDRWETRREPEAFRTIVQRHAGTVYSTCQRILRNNAEAQDVTQECFEALVGSVKAGRPRELGPWLHGTATKKSLMHLRSEGRRRSREAAYAAQQEDQVESQWNDVYSYVDEAIADLPAEIRSPVVAHFLYGQSHGAIARASGVPRRTVSNRIRKGLDLIGAALRTRGIAVPMATLATVLSTELVHAAPVPASLTHALGKLTLSETAAMSAGTGTPLGVPAVAGLVTLKKTVVGVFIAAAFVSGIAWWTTHGATSDPRTPAQSVMGAQGHGNGGPPPEVRAAAVATGEGLEATVSGTARFQDTGEPVPGVLVKAHNEKTDGIIQAVTDEHGNYTLTNLAVPEGGVDLLVFADTDLEGWRPVVSTPSSRLHRGEQLTGVDIMVTRNACSISGTVFAKETVWHPERIRNVLRIPVRAVEKRRKAQATLATEEERPLPAVRVVLEAQGSGSLSERKIAETTSDMKGRYEFTAIAPGSYVVVATPPKDAVQPRHDPHKKITLKDGEDQAEVDLTVQVDDVTVAGRVVDEAGHGVAGARVTAVPLDVMPPSGDDGRDRVVSRAIQTVADDDGRYRIEGLMPARSQDVAALVRGETRLPLYGRTYTVRAEANGFAPAQVTVPAIQERLVAFMRTYHEELRANPAATVKPLPPLPEATLPVAPGDVLQGIDIVLESETVITGHVTDTRGNALPGARIRLAFADPTSPREQPFRREVRAPGWVATGEGGAFVFGAVPAGTYFFEVDAGAGAQRARNAAMDIRSGSILEDIEVVVEAVAERGNIEGYVLSAATGAPIEEYALRVVQVDSPGEDSPRHGTFTNTKEGGFFCFEGVSPGTATLELKAQGFAQCVVQVAVRPGQTASQIFRLSAEGVIRGHVRRNGLPSAHGYVTFPQWEGGPYGGTGAEGSYEVKALPAGDYLVQYTMWLYEDARGGAQAVFHHWMNVEAGRATQVDVDYDGHGVIHGAFTGSPNTKWHVRLVDPSCPEGENMRAGTWKFQDNQRYEIPDVPPGTYRVVATCTDADGTVQEQSQTVSLADGEVREVDFAFP